MSFLWAWDTDEPPRPHGVYISSGCQSSCLRCKYFNYRASSAVPHLLKSSPYDVFYCEVLTHVELENTLYTKDLNSSWVYILKHFRNVHWSSWNIWKKSAILLFFIFKIYEIFKPTGSCKHLKSTHFIEIYCICSIKTQTILNIFCTNAHCDLLLWSPGHTQTAILVRLLSCPYSFLSLVSPTQNVEKYTGNCSIKLYCHFHTLFLFYFQTYKLF